MLQPHPEFVSVAGCHKTTRDGDLDGVMSESQQINGCDDRTRNNEVLPVNSCEDDEAHATMEVTLKLSRSVQTRVGGMATSIRSSRVRKGR